METSNAQAREAGQLSLQIDRHPAVAEGDGMLIGTIKIKGAMHCPIDVQAGDDLTVQIANADGETIAHAKLKGLHAQIKPIKDRGFVIGEERANAAEVDEDVR